MRYLHGGSNNNFSIEPINDGLRVILDKLNEEVLSGGLERYKEGVAQLRVRDTAAPGFYRALRDARARLRRA